MDGGTASSCAGLAATALPEMVSFSIPPQYFVPRSCGAAAGDESGALALTFDGPHGGGVYIVDSSGKELTEIDTWMFGTPLQQPHGFAQHSGNARFGATWGILHGQSVITADSTGNLTGRSTVANFTSDLKLPSAADPNGGELLAGDFSFGPFDDYGNPTNPILHAAIVYNGGDAGASLRWGPVALASTGTVLGVGVDLLGRSLVITDGSSTFGAGAISAEWFEKDGTPLTGEFQLLSNFTAGTTTWFETTALHGGGLLIRRMDATAFPDVTFPNLLNLPRVESQVLLTVASGSAAAQPAPEWMTSRRNVKLQLSPSGTSYVALPYGAANVECSQSIEVLGLDGTACGVTNFAIAPGKCDTLDLRMTADGTIVQQLPTAMEIAPDGNIGYRGCTWRWWPRAVR